MKITILNPEEVSKLFIRWGKFACKCYATPKEFAERVGKSCLETGHTSGSRSRYIEIEIEDVSRAMIDQLTRHEEGVVKNITSQRYVFNEFEYTTPSVVENDIELKEYYDYAMSKIKIMRNEFRELIEERTGLQGEKVNQVARGINPMNIHTSACFAFDVEALINLAHKRLCTTSQEEIRQFTKLLVDEVIKIIPELESHLVPICDYLLWCPESKKRSCGRRIQKSELIALSEFNKILK